MRKVSIYKYCINKLKKLSFDNTLYIYCCLVWCIKLNIEILRDKNKFSSIIKCTKMKFYRSQYKHIHIYIYIPNCLFLLKLNHYMKDTYKCLNSCVNLDSKWIVYLFYSYTFIKEKRRSKHSIFTLFFKVHSYTNRSILLFFNYMYLSPV